MRKYLMYLVWCMFCLPHLFRGQCGTSASVNAGSLVPSTAWQTITRAAGTKFYYTLNASPCNTYTFSFCQGGGSATFDTQLTITDNSTGSTYYAYNDDNCSLQSQIVWTPTVSGTFRVHVSQYSCSNPSAACTLAFIYASANTTNINYSLVGNASSASPYNCTTLTSATNNQLGCAWDVNSTLDFTNNFSYDFTINLGSSNAGADGMSFTIQNDPRGLCACGSAGGSMGAGGISNSLIVELDTYINTEDRDDFTGSDYIGCTGTLDLDHIDIWTGGTVNPDLDGNCNTTSAGERPALAWAVALKNGSSYYDIENGLNHTLRISWTTGSPGTLTVRVMDASATTTYGLASYSFNPMTVFGTNTPYFGFTASTGGLNNVQSFCNPSSLLPIKLFEFTAVKKNHTAVLNWITSTETDNEYFSVERSPDGKTWNEISRVPSEAKNGNSLVKLLYNFTDESLIQGYNYYRLQQFDKNGKSSVSSIQSVYEQTNMAVVFPNPFEKQFTLQLMCDEGTAFSYSVINNLGEVILSASHTQEQDGTFIKNISVDGPAGIYFLRLEAGGQHFNYKLMQK